MRTSHTADARRTVEPSPGPGAAGVVPFARREAKLIAFRGAVHEPKPQARDPIRLLFVCRTHAVLSPMAEGLAREAYKQLNISVESAGLSAIPVDWRAVEAMAEVGIDIGQTPATNVRHLDLASFEIVVSLGVHKLGVEHGQMAVAWDIPEFTRVTEATARARLRQVRDALSVRVRALGAILTATNRA
jgi:protein-tyrosine-phosphatase